MGLFRCLLYAQLAAPAGVGQASAPSDASSMDASLLVGIISALAGLVSIAVALYVFDGFREWLWASLKSKQHFFRLSDWENITRVKAIPFTRKQNFNVTLHQMPRWAERKYGLLVDEEAETDLVSFFVKQVFANR